VIFSHSVSAVELLDVHKTGHQEHPPAAHFLPFFGNSCTAIHLPLSTVIPPGEHINMNVYMRLTDMGRQEISLLAAYKATAEDKTSRHSIASFQVNLQMCYGHVQ
jgi:hypothetical protein